ncbi:MAG: circular bacteriocin, circularin A/uberolysin family [Oscillospiraceae bacterium]|nr:circular bacteriocin, circularin A/uberolysin family [Oscillospiraceae bacterium]
MKKDIKKHKISKMLMLMFMSGAWFFLFLLVVGNTTINLNVVANLGISIQQAETLIKAIEIGDWVLTIGSLAAAVGTGGLAVSGLVVKEVVKANIKKLGRRGALMW